MQPPASWRKTHPREEGDGRCLRCWTRHNRVDEFIGARRSLFVRIDESEGGAESLEQLTSEHGVFLTLRVVGKGVSYLLFEHPGGCAPSLDFARGLHLVGDAEDITLPPKARFSLFPEGKPVYGHGLVSTEEADDIPTYLPFCPIEWKDYRPDYWKEDDAPFFFFSNERADVVEWHNVEEEVEPATVPPWMVRLFEETEAASGEGASS